MRCIGEQHLVSVDEAFDAGGGLIETPSQARDLVAALDLDARSEIAGAKRFDAALQPLEPPREPPHDRASADGDHQRDGPKEGGEHERAGAVPGRHTCNQLTTVRQRYRNRGPGTRSHPTAAPTGSGERLTGGGQWLVGAAEQRQIRPQTLRQPVDRLLLRRRRRIRGGDKLGDDFAGDLELLPEWAEAREEVPKQARREHDQNEASHDGEIHLQIKSSHPRLPLDAPSPQTASYSSLLGFGEDIARAADGDDAPRLSWIVLDRRADAGNMHVDRPVERFELFALDRVHQRVSRHDATGMLGERQQQGELVTGERKSTRLNSSHTV